MNETLRKDTNGIDISIVAPMYNEELCVKEFVHRVCAAMRSLDLRYEIIAVNDGSTDGTEAILRQLCVEFANLQAVMLSRNSGQSAAISAGFQSSHGRYVVVMDSDLQQLPEEIPLLINEIMQGYDLVSGLREVRSESFLRRVVPSKVANWLLRVTTKCPVGDMGGFKCLRGDIARNLYLRAGQHRLLPALIYLMGGSVSEVTVSAPKRFAGTSNYGIRRTIDVLLDILMLWFESSGKSRPLYLFGRIALWTAILTIMVLAWLLYDDLINHDPITSRPAFYASIGSGLLSIHVLSIGLILEVLSVTQNRLTKLQAYRIREIIGSEDSADGFGA
ncbi:MAG: family 2 glycosyl transferase [Rhodospirillaceae bacterium]|nr:family 2 glycosyl transferase [Rhodospirillaceae bacterium]